MSEGYAHIQLKEADYQKIREQLRGQYAYFDIGSTRIPVVLDETLPSGIMKLVSRSPYTRFVLWVENIGD